MKVEIEYVAANEEVYTIIAEADTTEKIDEIVKSSINTIEFSLNMWQPRPIKVIETTLTEETYHFYGFDHEILETIKLSNIEHLKNSDYTIRERPKVTVTCTVGDSKPNIDLYTREAIDRIRRGRY